MLPISVVIIASNEAHNIARCVAAVKPYFDEVLVAINHCTDSTFDVAKGAGAKVVEVEWQGYSTTKNSVNQMTQNDWIFSLDADEVVTKELIESIMKCFAKMPSKNQVFSIKRRLIYNGQELKYGSVSNEWRPRLFNKEFAEWNSNLVHEELSYKESTDSILLDGLTLHYSYIDEDDHRKRLDKYARLFAQHMHSKGKRASWYKMALSPYFGFIKNVVFRLGFLDGLNGFKFAYNEMRYTQSKYRFLKEMYANA